MKRSKKNWIDQISFGLIFLIRRYHKKSNKSEVYSEVKEVEYVEYGKENKYDDNIFFKNTVK